MSPFIRSCALYLTTEHGPPVRKSSWLLPSLISSCLGYGCWPCSLPSSLLDQTLGPTMHPSRSALAHTSPPTPPRLNPIIGSPGVEVQDLSLLSTSFSYSRYRSRSRPRYIPVPCSSWKPSLQTLCPKAYACSRQATNRLRLPLDRLTKTVLLFCCAFPTLSTICIQLILYHNDIVSSPRLLKQGTL